MNKIVIENNSLIKARDKKIKELEMQIDEIRWVIKSEKEYNETLKEQVKKYELIIETLQEVNEKFLNKIAHLRHNIEILTK
tara:strand:+ start:535 stop:777 length:243 start_codon:yes stop_codon:yes gene_type:complete